MKKKIKRFSPPAGTWSSFYLKHREQRDGKLKKSFEVPIVFNYVAATIKGPSQIKYSKCINSERIFLRELEIRDSLQMY